MLELMPGVSAELKYVHGDPEPKLEFATNGEFPASAYDLGSYVRYDKGGNVEIHLCISRLDGLNPAAFDQQPDKTIVARRDQTPEGETATFVKKVRVSINKDTLALQTSRNPENFIRLLLPSADGSWEIAEVALVAQDDRLFLTCQRFYAGRAYRAEDGSVAVPEYPGWTQIKNMLTNMFRDRDLPDESEYRAKPDEPVPEASHNRGIIKWYNLAQQWGVAYASKDGKAVQARVHWSHSRGKHGRIVFFEPNEAITFGAIAPAKSADPERATSFRHELHEVVSDLAPPKAANQTVLKALRERYAR